MGNEYEKIIEIFNHQVNIKYPLDTSTTYFDCTNFYFEIDKEDEFRKKGPSKENRHDPIIGLGLLLDANQIPIGMKLYPGNESEKPVIRDVIKELKDRNQISGKTVRVAGKGINCAENIIDALKNNDGYLFSKSVKQLPETEKTWVLLKDGYKKVTDSNGTLLYLIKECIDEFPYTYIDENGKKHTVEK
jgi:transposase